MYSQWHAVPSDGSGLADQVWKFAVSRVWKQNAACSSHKAEYAEDEEWQSLVVNAWKIQTAFSQVAQAHFDQFLLHYVLYII